MSCPSPSGSSAPSAGGLRRGFLVGQRSADGGAPSVSGGPADTPAAPAEPASGQEPSADFRLWTFAMAPEAWRVQPSEAEQIRMARAIGCSREALGWSLVVEIPQTPAFVAYHAWAVARDSPDGVGLMLSNPDAYARAHAGMVSGDIIDFAESLLRRQGLPPPCWSRTFFNHAAQPQWGVGGAPPVRT